MSEDFGYFDSLNLLEEEVVSKPKPIMAPLTVLMVCWKISFPERTS